MQLSETILKMQSINIGQSAGKFNLEIKSNPSTIIRQHSEDYQLLFDTGRRYNLIHLLQDGRKIFFSLYKIVFIK